MKDEEFNQNNYVTMQLLYYYDVQINLKLNVLMVNLHL